MNEEIRIRTYCKECGAELEAGGEFCGNCGMPVDAEFAESGSFISVKKKKKGIVVAVALLILGVLIASLTVFGGADKIRVARLCSLGERYLSELEYEEAIVAFEAAIEIKPKTEDAYIGLADTYVGLEDYESAVEALDRGIRETDSESLKDYRDDVQEEWDDRERRICGTVFRVDTALDDSNNDGIEGFSVSLTDRSGETTIYTTDENGYYETGRLKKGTYSLYFYMDGYVDYECEIELTGGRYKFDVFLEPDNIPEIPMDVYDNINSDFEQIIEDLWQNYSYIQQNLNLFTLNEAIDVYQWYIDDNAVLRKAVVFADEISLRERTEEYYYEDDYYNSDRKLLFCCEYDSAGNVMQFYFQKGLLYRFVDDTGKVMDFSDGTDPYSILEAGEIFEHAALEQHYYGELLE